MKVHLLHILILFLLCSCLIGKKDNAINYGTLSSRPYYEPTPHKMVYVPRGSFTIGAADEINNEITPQKRVSIEAFWIDATEITNDEYRQYVYWVRDSLFRKKLGEQMPDQYFLAQQDNPDIIGTNIDWDKKIDWKDPQVTEILSDMFMQKEEAIFFGKTLDVHKLTYTYSWIDYKQAAKRINTYNFETESYNGIVSDKDGRTKQLKTRSDFVFSETTPIYPDTLVWIRDYSYAYNEPRMKTYFSHLAFDNYPVVGVTWKQAKAFCHWRTMLYNNYLISNGQPEAFAYRLPTEAEWEYAARANKSRTLYPWGSYYVGSELGCYIANFKPRRGNYVADTKYSASTIPVASFAANDFNIYDMAGNVSEWTSSAFNESAYVLYQTLIQHSNTMQNQ